MPVCEHEIHDTRMQLIAERREVSSKLLTAEGYKARAERDIKKHRAKMININNELLKLED